MYINVCVQTILGKKKMQFIAETNDNIMENTTSFILKLAGEDIPREKYLEFVNVIMEAMKNMLPNEIEQKADLIKQVLDRSAKSGTLGGTKISFIKSYRELTGECLKNSLHWVEENMKGHYND